MSVSQRAARRFGGLGQVDRAPRDCGRCGVAFTPPRLYPRRVVCSACRDAIKHPGRATSQTALPALVEMEASS